ncbi:MAG: hypothetical protein IKM00_08275 [Clostridia bacterium]|nr:hypothetical protein [Clostridia bacterium]
MKKILTFTLCVLLVCLIPVSVCAADGTEAAAETAPTENAAELISVKFEEWVLPHLEEISVVITLIFSLFYQMRKHTLLSRSIGTMNNNAVSIAEENSSMMSRALTGMENASLAVTAYDERIAALLDAFRSTAEDKERLERELAEIKGYLQTSAEANLEFSNELAELLSLANIPNFKKEEIGARHLAAVRAIRSTEHISADAEEVSDRVGEEA